MLKHYYGCSGESHGDKCWIVQRIGLVPIRMQKELTDRYNDIYKTLGVTDEKNQRRRSNLWLLRTTEKHKCKQSDDGEYF